MSKIIIQSRGNRAMRVIFLNFVLLAVVLLKAVPVVGAEPVAAKKAENNVGQTSPNAALKATQSSVKTVRVHGVAFSVEYPERLRLNGERKNAWGTRYIAPSGSANWFHVSIPVVSADQDVASELKSVFLLFNAKNCTVEEVHLWDGANKIGQFRLLKLTGDNSTEVTSANKFVLPPGIKIKNSLGVSVGVSFGSTGVSGGMGEMIFTSVGAEYY